MELEDYERERQEYLNRILESEADRKLIVAGPGTGKTFTFREILKKTERDNNLAITFINNLANDLEIDLHGLADSKTFHKFCVSQLHKFAADNLGHDFIIYPGLSKIINEDLLIFGESPGEIKPVLCQMDEENSIIKMHIDRGNYYHAVGFDDCVYRVIKIYETDPDLIPLYDLIVVDEYQDFNKLEVTLIELLAQKIMF